MDFKSSWEFPKSFDQKTYSFDFFLTKFIHPLKDPIVLSKELGIVIDNPRTEEEISFFKEIVKQARKGDRSMKFLSSEQNLNLATVFLREVLGKVDPFIEEYFKDYKKQDALDYFCRMFVVLRYNPKAKFEKIAKEHAGEIKRYYDGISETKVREVNTDNAIYYSYLLSILMDAGDDLFEADNFFTGKFTQYFQLDIPDAKQIMDGVHTWLDLLSHTKKRLKRSKSLNYKDINHKVLPAYISDLRSYANGVEKLLKTSNDEQILYLGELLKLTNEGADERSKLMNLVSAIELLLTRNPDTSRFNVEDSINKQFVLKVATIVYNQDKTVPIKELASRLKTIYTQRSNIAHGNFKELKKFLRNLYSEEDKLFSDLISDCLCYVRLIFKQYVEDPDYIEFIKER